MGLKPAGCVDTVAASSDPDMSMEVEGDDFIQGAALCAFLLLMDD
ncbi:MAG: hypothetical protein ETSY2_09620 [Candidatus Entotheonella gemina]|uniref:Uncharacterized protein n=1 Tax=Candidatus Entotheonella gemina TaxID=1429439 RepID=W4MBY8_9BACT|nr:MAG: hypothetical protein ETSY2_09620 [Candidatus Entotheonella gemina]